jgi:hypothetical protein
MYRATLLASGATCALQFGPQALASSTVANPTMPEQYCMV